MLRREILEMGAYTLLLLTMVFDHISTNIGLAIGLTEANPLLLGPELWIIADLVFNSLLILATWKIIEIRGYESRYYFIVFVPLLVGFVRFLVVLNNTVLIFQVI